MTNPLQSKCTGREGVLYVNIKGQRKLVTDPDGRPQKFECTCHAKQGILGAIGKLVALVMLDVMPVADLPKPDDFTYEFIDEAPKEVEPTSCDDAKSVLAKIMEKAK